MRSFLPAAVLLVLPGLINGAPHDAPAASVAPAATAPAAGFEAWSDGATLRLDYHHSGVGGEETFALDALRREGAWPGSHVNLVDPLNLGAYRFEVRDPQSHRVLFAQGFSSIYGEWETTAEAAVTRRSFHESLRFPYPRRPVQVTLLKRGRDNLFREAADFVVDPSSPEIRREPVTAAGTVWSLLENGPPETNVDLLILGDGYTADETEIFHEEARHLVDALFATPPFSTRKRDFNVRAIDRPSENSGVDRPSDGLYRRTPLGVTYDIFGSERYALTLDNRALRDIAAQAPYEFVAILMNEAKYGGGGIYNLFATTATRSGSAAYVFVHELGHHLAALADEYYTSSVAYDTSTPIVEPWEPNVTACSERDCLKWADLVAPDTPLPTPWEKHRYEAFQDTIQTRRKEMRARGAPESEMNALFKEEIDWVRPFLAGQKHAGGGGLFEGAGYRAEGLYRATTDCIMFTRNPERFCPVCSRAIERVIDWTVGR